MEENYNRGTGKNVASATKIGDTCDAIRTYQGGFLKATDFHRLFDLRTFF